MEVGTKRAEKVELDFSPSSDLASNEGYPGQAMQCLIINDVLCCKLMQKLFLSFCFQVVWLRLKRDPTAENAGATLDRKVFEFVIFIDLEFFSGK